TAGNPLVPCAARGAGAFSGSASAGTTRSNGLIYLRRIRNVSDYLRRSEPDAEALRSAPGAPVEGGAGMVCGAFSCRHARRSDAEISPGYPGEYLHPYGHKLLGNGGEH